MNSASLLIQLPLPKAGIRGASRKISSPLKSELRANTSSTLPGDCLISKGWPAPVDSISECSRGYVREKTTDQSRF